MAPLKANLEPQPQKQENGLASEDVLVYLKPFPALRLHLEELSHPATSTLLSQIDSTRVLPNAIRHVLKNLYTPLHNDKSPVDMHIPATRSVTLVLRSMPGVAYTTGLVLDSAHKEIHLSLDHAARFIDQPARFRDELLGIITHEMVHAYQWDSEGSCPGGLLEGIADYVRLKAGLVPPHWKRDEAMDRWDVGYQRTAYFLSWLEEEYGSGTVARINAALREGQYDGDKLWQGIFGEGRDVEWLFKRYRDSLKGKGKDQVAIKDDGQGVGQRGDADRDADGEKDAPEDGDDNDVVLVELEDEDDESMAVDARLALDVKKAEMTLGSRKVETASSSTNNSNDPPSRQREPDLQNSDEEISMRAVAVALRATKHVFRVNEEDLRKQEIVSRMIKTASKVNDAILGILEKEGY